LQHLLIKLEILLATKQNKKLNSRCASLLLVLFFIKKFKLMLLKQIIEEY